MADLGTFANIAEVIGALFVMGGLTFGVYELRQARLQRRRDSAFEMFNNMTSKEFIAGQKLLYVIPTGLSRADLESQYAEHMDEIGWVLTSFERVATMVYNDLVEFNLVSEFYYVTIVNIWTKLEHYIVELREVTGKPNLYVYIEKLAKEIMASDPENIGLGAKKHG